MNIPDKSGYFRVNKDLALGGRFVPETVMSALYELEEAYRYFMKDIQFRNELDYYLKEYAGRPTPLYYAQNLSNLLNNKVYLKREDLLHTGAHKINNTIGQVLLAKKMQKRRIIAETGAGQHGVATATACALFNMDCVIYMGSEDMRRQRLNVFRMQSLGAEVREVKSGSLTLKDAINEALRDWITNVRTTHYVIGSVVGPHPYPMLVRDFQSVIGKEVKEQLFLKEKKLPDYLVACVGGGSNAMGLFHAFYEDNKVEFIGVEAGGIGDGKGEHAASLVKGSLGVLHGSLSYLLQDENGQILTTHSIAPGLDYPGVGPEHSFYKLTKRAKYFAVSDREAIKGFYLLAKLEGILPALEPAHAIFFVYDYFRKNKITDKIIVINLSGRGDKDLEIVMKYKE